MPRRLAIIDTTPFTITVDETRRNLRVTLKGCWDEATAHAYISALQVHAAQLDRTSGLTYWLLDATEFTVQPSAVADVFLRSLPPLVVNAVVALATPHVLSAMQAKRAAANHRQNRFDTVEEAEAWLAEMREAK